MNEITLIGIQLIVGLGVAALAVALLAVATPFPWWASLILLLAFDILLLVWAKRRLRKAAAQSARD